MRITLDEQAAVVSIRKDANDLPDLAVEELNKERAKREKLEQQMAAVLLKLNMGEG